MLLSGSFYSWNSTIFGNAGRNDLDFSKQTINHNVQSSLSTSIHLTSFLLQDIPGGCASQSTAHQVNGRSQAPVVQKVHIHWMNHYPVDMQLVLKAALSCKTICYAEQVRSNF